MRARCTNLEVDTTLAPLSEKLYLHWKSKKKQSKINDRAEQSLRAATDVLARTTSRSTVVAKETLALPQRLTRSLLIATGFTHPSARGSADRKTPSSPGGRSLFSAASLTSRRLTGGAVPQRGFMLLYLNDDTFLGEQGKLLAAEVMEAIESGVPIQMVHERGA